MKKIGRWNAKGQETWWITMLLSMGCLGMAMAGDPPNTDTTPGIQTVAAIRIFDQYGRQVPSGKRDVGSQTIDVTVGPLENEFSFMPDAVNIRVGDTVRWTWASDFHSVTSGDNCFPDQRFCSPDNMHCEAGILSNTGTVYEFTFTQAGTYQYFCALHCLAGMTGVVNVRSSVVPRPRPTPAPRPAL